MQSREQVQVQRVSGAGGCRGRRWCRGGAAEVLCRGAKMQRSKDAEVLSRSCGVLLGAE